MHSLSSRFNSMLLFTATVLAVMCGLNFVSGVLMSRTVEPARAGFAVTGFKNFEKSGLYKWDTVLFSFNISMDLKDLHNWNLKQIFLYVQVDYVSPKGLNSSSIIADWILEVSPNRTVQTWDFEYNVKWADYPLRDVYNNLKGQELTFKVQMEYMPYVGLFFKRTLSELKYRMPEDYKKTSS